MSSTEDVKMEEDTTADSKAVMDILYTLFTEYPSNYYHDGEGDDLSVALTLKKHDLKYNSILVPTTKDSPNVMERKMKLASLLHIQPFVEEAKDGNTIFVTAPVDLSDLVHKIENKSEEAFIIIVYSGMFNMKENHKWIPKLRNLPNVTLFDLSMYTANKDTKFTKLKNTYTLMFGTDFLEQLKTQPWGPMYREFTSEFNKENIKPYSEDKKGVKTGSLYEDLKFFADDKDNEKTIEILYDLYKNQFSEYLKFNRNQTNLSFTKNQADIIRNKIKQKKVDSVSNLDVDLPFADNFVSLLIHKVMTKNCKGLKFIRSDYEVVSQVSKDGDTTYMLATKSDFKGNCFSVQFTPDFSVDEAVDLYRSLWIQ